MADVRISPADGVILRYCLYMLRIVLITIVLVPLGGCGRVTPSHSIPVRHDYIEAGIQAGDTIEVTMVDGELRTFEVVDVRSNAIVGPDGVISIGSIKSIVKRSWAVPGHPCGANEAVGCSIPEVVLLLSDDYSEQAGKFHPACVMHDFCYRHGHATYGDTREQCDKEFLEDMKEVCAGTSLLNLLDAKGFSMCRVAADQTYEAVRRNGEPHFRTSTSSFCEFRLDEL